MENSIVFFGRLPLVNSNYPGVILVSARARERERKRARTDNGNLSLLLLVLNIKDWMLLSCFRPPLRPEAHFKKIDFESFV